ncbi:MAG: hypothetical protein JNK45_21365 [Myxococcales bacterium]|nr:hypothetical protein [Myxococcales bacterium]
MLDTTSSWRTATLAAALVLGAPAVTMAAEPAPPNAVADSDAGDGLAHALTIGARVGNPGYGALLGYRLRLRHGIGVGLEVEAGYAPRAYIGGHLAHDDAVLRARAPLFFPVFRSRRLTMALGFAPGVRMIRSASPGFARRRGVSITADVGAFAYVHAHPRLTWLVGFELPVGIQIDPITDIDTLGTLLVTGPVVPLGDRLSWYATLEGGGLYGSDGDAGKFLVRGTTGLRVVLGASARHWRAL